MNNPFRVRLFTARALVWLLDRDPQMFAEALTPPIGAEWSFWAHWVLWLFVTVMTPPSQ